MFPWISEVMQYELKVRESWGMSVCSFRGCYKIVATSDSFAKMWWLGAWWSLVHFPNFYIVEKCEGED